MRLAESRRIVAGKQIWLIPGPETTCVGRLIGGESRITGCQPTADLARRGLLLASACSTETPERIDVLGIVPPGVDRVRIVPRHAKPRSRDVTGGAWLARRVPYPLDVRFGTTRLKANYETRACWD